MWSPFGWLELSASSNAEYRRALRAMNALITHRLAEARDTGPADGTLLASLLGALSGVSGDPLSEAELVAVYLSVSPGLHRDLPITKTDLFQNAVNAAILE